MKTIFDSFRLDGRKALVTGSSRGIGRAIAFALGQAGAKVVFHGSHVSPKLTDAVETAKSEGIAAETATGDLSDPEAVANLAKNAGAVDILVLNASVQKYQSIDRFDPEEFSRQFQVNVAASLQLIEAVLPAMKAKKWGRILAIGSVNQFRPAARLPVYSATKAALENIVRNAARSYGPFGITVNTLAPGVIATDRNAETLSHADTVETLLQGIPVGRFGQAQDCAGMALLLCSEAGSYVTGANIPVTGGMHL